MRFRTAILIIVIFTITLSAGCTTNQYPTTPLKENSNLKFVPGNTETSSSGSDYLVFTYINTNSSFEIKNQGNEIAKNVVVKIDLVSPIEKNAIFGSCPKKENSISIGDIEPAKSATGFYSVRIYPNAMCNYQTVSTIYSE